MHQPARKLILLFLLLLLIASFGLFVHEAGHGLTAILLGGTITYFEVMPGLQLFPAIALHPWNGTVACIDYHVPGWSPGQHGAILFMGCGMTAGTAVLALLLLVLLKPQGTVSTVLLLIAALLPLDIASYSIFPALGWRHWIIFGGWIAEPLQGARAMGISTMAFYFGLAAYLLAVYAVLACFLRRIKGNRHRPPKTAG